jgi:hypothetical protein
MIAVAVRQVGADILLDARILLGLGHGCEFTRLAIS